MRALLSLILLSVFALASFGAPYHGQTRRFSQPDGTSVEVKLLGDEYYTRGESLSGYTVVRDEKTGWICYATLSADKSQLESTGIVYNSALKSTSVKVIEGGQHIDLDKSRIEQIAKEKRKQLDGDKPVKPSPIKLSNLKSGTISGTVKGLCILVDFPDEPATISVNEVKNFCNADNYTGYGNTSSVKQFFKEMSGGKLIYDNVVYGYFRAPKDFKTYDDPTYSGGVVEILAMALDALKAQGFDFSTLTTNQDGSIAAINLMFSGYAKTWGKGMWYHQGWYPYFSANGVTSGSYNCSPADDELSLAVVCHENGHMIAKWPDTYKYDSLHGPDGIGNFDLMCGYGSAYNPIFANPYFLLKNGWVTPVDIASANLNITDQANNSTVYRYRIHNSTEYYILKALQKTGHYTAIADEGLTIWHINEMGDNQTWDHEVYLVHANNNNIDHSQACFKNSFNPSYNDNTTPNALWWDGSASGLNVFDISGEGATMTYKIGTPGDTNPVVTFYQDCSFGGTSHDFTTGNYTTSLMTSNGMADNYASSVKVTNGYKIDIYKDDNYGGATVSFSSNNDCFVAAGFNDVMSSFKIRANGVTTLNGDYFIKNRVSGKFMEISGASLDDGGNVIQWPYSGSTNQKWQLTNLGDGVYSVINTNSGKSLDVESVSTDDGANVHQWAYLGNDNQKFIIQESNPGYYQLIAVHSSKVVEVVNASTADGANVQQWTDNSQQCSEWELILDTPAPVASFTSDRTSTCTGAVQFADLSSYATSWLWNFGDGKTSTEQNPLHTYATNGVFTVTLTVTNIKGSNTITKTNLISYLIVTNPATSEKIICSGKTATLTATGSNNILWYKSATDAIPIATGSSYTTEPLTQTATYYVANSMGGAPTSVGAADTLIGAGIKYAGDVHGLLFDVLKELTLQSVKVYSYTNGDRTIQLLDAVNGNVLQTKTVNVPVGYQRIALDFNIKPGNQYFLKCSGLVDFQRNSAGAKFPYTINGLISITQTDLEPAVYPAYYYFFYDWKVVESGCASALVPVKVNVNPLPTKPGVTQAGNSLSASPINASYSYRWFFNGNPINGATAANYTFSGNGLYKVEAKLNGCPIESNPLNVVVTGSDEMAADGFSIYPNPADKQVNLSFGSDVLSDVEIVVYNSAGETVYTNTVNTNGTVAIDVTNYANGVYFCKLTKGMVEQKGKIVVMH